MRESGNCPICRTVVHTITNVLPEGGTEIIEISRAELVAHKVNELHTILMILFTTMSHTLLPEVSNYMNQLNEIARELNVPTTASRMEDSMNSSETGATNSPSTAASSRATSSAPTDVTMRSPRSVSSSSDARASSQASSNRMTLASALGSQSTQSSAPNSRSVSPSPSGSGVASSTPTPTPTSQPASKEVPSPNDPSPLAAASKVVAQPVDTSRRQAAQATTKQADTCSNTANKSVQSQLSPSSLQVAAAKQLPAATPNLNAISTPSSLRYPNLRAEKSLLRPQPMPNRGATLKFVYQPANQIAGRSPSPSPSASTSTPLISSATTSRQQFPSRPQAQKFASSRPTRSSHRPMTAEDYRRIEEHRQRDIDLLTESFNKINQVYEPLMIMHLVVHRNQVDVRSARQESASDDSD